MTAVAASPGIPTLRGPDMDFMSTIPDPRSRTATPNPPKSGSASPSHHPDLSNEIATLSNKLINAINHQTSLDDSLAATRHDLELARERIRQLEAGVKEHEDMVAQGVLVKKADMEDEMIKLMSKVVEERKLRTAAEKDKKNIEQELENLTTALFEEANKMVSAARLERESSERKNDQLKSQIADMETLLVSHQEQLAELKAVMQQMTTDKEEMEANTNNSTTPSTPALMSRESKESLGKISDGGLHMSPHPMGSDGVSPSYPTSFSHLLHPVLRTDLQAYDDFNSLMRMPRHLAAGSRTSSGSYGGLNVMGIGGLGQNPSVSTLAQFYSSGSASSISSGTVTPSPATTPTTPASNASTASSQGISPTLIPLKETRFYKRALVEDIEPTLRLDTAPGLSWLARRSVLNSMCEGSLVVEPMPTRSKLHTAACSLCGESRKDEEHARRHRFRTSENEYAQRYPLCAYCLGRVRASCDFLGFLRMVKDGHWRTDGEEGEKGAWEESVRLRERMFWARIGGGVVPAFMHTRDTPRSASVDDLSATAEKPHTEALKFEADEEKKHRMVEVEADPFISNEKRVTIGDTVICAPEEMKSLPDIPSEAQLSDESAPTPKMEDKTDKSDEIKDEHTDLQDASRYSMTSNYSQLSIPSSGMSSPRSEKRLSLTIPGAFDSEMHVS